MSQYCNSAAPNNLAGSALTCFTGVAGGSAASDIVQSTSTAASPQFNYCVDVTFTCPDADPACAGQSAGTVLRRYSGMSTAVYNSDLGVRQYGLNVTAYRDVYICGASLCNAPLGGEALLPILQRATERHRALTLDAVQGAGCDRHLFALQLLAQRRGVLGVHEAAGPAPAPLPLFSDPAFAHFKDIRLSTSTMASSALDGGGFGPVNDHSYAVGYGVEERGCHLHIMAEAAGRAVDNGAHAAQVGGAFEGSLDVDRFAEGVEGALRDISAAIAGRRREARGKK
jgi:hypothetical protein